ncbi:MAG: LacI family DNA-binding transcriptional regulator [Thermoclostridium sp.]|nr:LacI family DNA-binding transcriptional regulator [Thermoclostridium sp.]
MPKTEEIIRKSGVSRSTLFRFLRGDNVRPDARKAIIEAMHELGCETDGLVLRDIVLEISVSKEFERFKGFTEVIQGITERAEERNVKVQLVIRSGDQITRDYEKWNENSNTKGILIIGKDLEDEVKEGVLLRQKKVPHLFINRVMEEPEESYIAVDVRKAACEMVQFLLEKGHRKIAALGYPELRRIDRDKLNGYYDAFHQKTITIDKKYLQLLHKGESAENAIHTILGMDPLPDAFFGICDSYAMQFINEAHRLGLKVPEDIAVVGMDDLDIAQYFKPSLTTVRTPFRKIGTLAVDQILLLITESLDSVKTIVNHQLFIREST